MVIWRFLLETFQSPQKENFGQSLQSSNQQNGEGEEGEGDWGEEGEGVWEGVSGGGSEEGVVELTSPVPD